MKRLFISTNYYSLRSITREEGVKRFKDLGKEECTILPVGDSSTLFLISQELSDSSQLSSLQIGEKGFEDYLLYHDGKTSPTIIGLFDPCRTQPGHHEWFCATNEMNYRAFAEALQVILDDRSPANEKAEVIINIIWPNKNVLKKEGLKLFTRYKRTAPASSALCPPVFKEGGMKKAFTELRGKSIGDRDAYNASLAQLTETFSVYYNDVN